METSKSQHSGCYCDDEAVVTHSGSVRNFFECPWSDETLTCVNCEAKIHIKCLQSPTPSSLINDYLFLLTCARCASNNEEHFVRPEKLPMVYIVTLLMHHLQSAEEGGKRGYFHYRHDVAKLLHLHHALLMPKTKTQNKNLHISVASVVSTYGRHIESGFTALGEAGWWKLIENEPPFLSKVYKQACRNPVDLKPEEPALQRRATRKKKQLSDEYVADFFRPKRSKGKAKQAAPAQPPAQLLPPAQTVVACKENSDDESLTIVDIVDQPESMNDATPQSVDIKSEPTIKHEHLMGPYELTVSEIKEELSGQPPMDSDYDDPTLTPSITESGIDIDTFALCDELPDVKGETDTERNLNSTTTSDTELATVDKSLDNGYEAPQIVQLDSTATSERTTPTAGKSLGGDDDITQSNTSGKGQSSFTAAEHGDASGTESEVESGREGLSTRSSSPGVEETKPAVLRRSVRSWSVYEEEKLLALLNDHFYGTDNGGSHQLRLLRRQLHVRKVKRAQGIPLFDINEYLTDSELIFKPKLFTLPSNASQSAGQSAPLVTNTGIANHRVLDRYQVKSSRSSDDLFVPFISRLHGASHELKSTRSCYTARILKPYIWRDVETRPPKLKILDEIRRRGVDAGRPADPTPDSIDYKYVKAEHIPVVNKICRQAFWPSIDLSECLQYSDFSCIAMYKKLVIGFAFMVPDVNHNEAYISFIYTHPDWRGAGIASVMVYHLIQTCMGKDVTLHVSMTNPAIGLYLKFGFKVVGIIHNFYEKFHPGDSSLSPHAFYMKLERY